jgi:hypothetical protein
LSIIRLAAGLPRRCRPVSSTLGRMNEIASSLAAQGYALSLGLLNPSECDALAKMSGSLSGGSVGTRCLLNFAWCRDFAATVRTRLESTGALLPSARAVQCTYFEKSKSMNWLVPVHQDLSIPVAARSYSPDWRAWSVKEGGLFAQPPVAVLQHLLAVRVHLDECGPNDGPLRVVPKSHQLGIVPSERAVTFRQGEVTCLAARGDALLLRPLVLHSSSKASGTSRRRVLHLLFGPASLPDGVAWQNAA